MWRSGNSSVSYPPTPRAWVADYLVSAVEGHASRLCGVLLAPSLARVITSPEPCRRYFARVGDPAVAIDGVLTTAGTAVVHLRTRTGPRRLWIVVLTRRGDGWQAVTFEAER